MLKQIKLLLIPLVLTLLIACGGADEGSTSSDAPQAASISVVQHDNYYGDNNDNVANPPVWTVPAGARVQIAIENEGGLEHNWAIVEGGTTLPDDFSTNPDPELLQYDAGLLAAGNSKNATFTAPSEPGSYTIVCTVAGHYPNMQGVLEVEG